MESCVDCLTVTKKSSVTPFIVSKYCIKGTEEDNVKSILLRSNLG